MYFKSINDIEDYIVYLKKKCDSNLFVYDDLAWFETNKYITSSEYLGELMIFIQEIIDKDIFNDEKNNLLDLLSSIKILFNKE